MAALGMSALTNRRVSIRVLISLYLALNTIRVTGLHNHTRTVHPTMKTLVICAFVIFAVSVMAERCRHADDCVVTMCAANSTHIACHQERCTCDAFIPCSDITDCMNAGRCHDRDRHYHCLDRECVCIKDDAIP